MCSDCEDFSPDDRPDLCEGTGPPQLSEELRAGRYIGRCQDGGEPDKGREELENGKTKILEDGTWIIFYFIETLLVLA